MLCLDFRLQAAEAHVVARFPLSVADAAKDLQRSREVAEDNAVKGENGDTMFAVWLNSCEDCLFGHSSNYRAFFRIGLKEEI
jgi:hypothetical protein